MARPVKYHDKCVVAVTSHRATTKLQARSERRAIINAIIEAGGTMTLGELDDKFGYDVRSRVMALSAVGWLEVTE